MALPCFHKVRDSFPDANITLLTNQPIMAKAAPLQAVLGNEYFFDRVLAYPVGTRNPLVLLSLIQKIRALHIDTVVNLTAARTKKSVLRDQLFFRAAGAKQLIGFPSTPEDFGVTDPVTGEQEWEALKLARRLEELGPVALDDSHYWDMRLTVAERNVAAEALADFSPHSPMLAISIGTKLQANNWGNENWIALLQQLRTTLPGWQLVTLGAAEEAAFSDTLLQAWGSVGRNLCGKMSPRESAAVLQQASLFIGHDSGPIHLAACVDTPCVGIFAARNLPRQWYPRGANNQIIYHRVECAGCGLETCIVQQKKCILSITVAEVQQAVQKIISTHQPRMLPTA